MVDIKTLLPELRKLVVELAEDLLARSIADSVIDAGLRDAFQKIEQGGRTAQAFETWRDDYLDQVSVAWVLACVFVRFMEDNELVDECWFAGEGSKRKLAEDSYDLYFSAHPHDTDREYFQSVFREVGKIAAAKDLFAEGKTPLWAVAPSGDAAMKLLKFWREQIPETGILKRSFQVESGDTRFLGDLYQELSQRAKDKFALLQTPVFVEEFILDRTLSPALSEFGLEKVRMIDPTCGSGHFLLGGFHRLFEKWCSPDYTTGNSEKDAQKALDGIWGVDINPFAVAIARFRLIVAAIQASGLKQLKQAPNWKIHLAIGDSLLFGNRFDQSGEKVHEQGWLSTNEESWAPDIYACEDRAAVLEALGQQYEVVVGNPPYITVGDDALNAAYRKRYSSCHRLYSLAVPFAERFFDLCKTTASGRQCGYVGMITANSFMKRIFGKKLIESYLPTVDLTHVIDTSIAYIPGHTTSTVILFGRNRRPVLNTVRAVLGIKGEDGVPDDPAVAVVWQSLIKQMDTPNTVSAYCSSSDMPREVLHKHPWSIGGGGAAELAESLQEKRAWQLGELVSEIGFGAVTRDDEVYLLGASVTARHGIPKENTRTIVSGDGVRDWSVCNPVTSLFPYDPTTLAAFCPPAMERFLWPWKAQLSIRVAYGMTQLERGNKWYEFSMLFRDRLRSPMSIAFAEIATHAHFVFDDGANVFTQSAPIIKLKKDADLNEHFALLGILNSSTVCFWAKQVMPCKGLGGQGGGIKPEHWSRAYVHSGTLTKMCPIPPGFECIAGLAQNIDLLGKESRKYEPAAIIAGGVKAISELLLTGRQKFEEIHRRMVALQEEIDWRVYKLFGLCEGSEIVPADLNAGIYPEDRPVERMLSARIEHGEKSIYYDVHLYRGTGKRSQPLSLSLQSVFDERLRIIEKNAEIRLIEQVDFKRRWQVEPWEKKVASALRHWLLDRLETQKYIRGILGSPELATTAQMADIASVDSEFLEVATLFRGRADFDVAALVSELVQEEAIPFLPVLRYKPSGLRKRELWERTWEIQRLENSGLEKGEIPVPPKYTSADFQKPDYFRLRGKLDIPKERWISYPYCTSDGDPSLVVGWAGWNHLEQATALIAYYDARKREGWDVKRLTPLLAGLDQLLPWIHQWHAEIDPEFGETAGQSFQTLLGHDAHELGLTLEDIRNWAPPAKVTKASTKQPRTTKKKIESEEDETTDSD